MFNRTLLLFMLAFLLNCKHQGYRQPDAAQAKPELSDRERDPFSDLTWSPDRRLVFVLLSSIDPARYLQDAVDHWEAIGYEKSRLREAAKDLEQDLKDEVSLRTRFNTSGLFRADGALIYQTSDFPRYFDHTFVLNDGRIVAVNRFVSQSDASFGWQPSSAELAAWPEDALMVLSDTGDRTCGNKLVEVLTETDKVQLTSHGFYWAEPDHVNIVNDTFISIRKLSGKTLRIAVRNCELDNNRSD